MVILIALLGLCSVSAYASTGRTINQFGPLHDLVVGSDHVCVLNNIGRVYCWGDSSKGQLRITKGMGVVNSLIAGNTYTCAANRVGRVYCWGGGREKLWVPPQAQGTEKLWQVGTNQICGALSSGRAICWYPLDLSGMWFDQQLPLGSEEVHKLYSVSGWDSSYRKLCMISKNHHWYCWENNEWVLKRTDIRDAQAHCTIALSGQTECDYALDEEPVLFPANPSGIDIVRFGVGGWRMNCSWNQSGITVCSHPGPTTSAIPRLKNIRKIRVGLGGEVVHDNYLGEDILDPDSVGYIACALAAGDLARCWGTKPGGVLMPTVYNDLLAQTQVKVRSGRAWPLRLYDLKHSWFNRTSRIKYDWQIRKHGRWTSLGKSDSQLRIGSQLKGHQLRFCGGASNGFGRRVICSHPSPTISRRDLG